MLVTGVGRTDTGGTDLTELLLVIEAFLLPENENTDGAVGVGDGLLGGGGTARGTAVVFPVLEGGDDI